MVGEDGVIVIFGTVLTVTATVAVLVQPKELAPINVYVCVEGGVTTALEPTAPVDQL
jgi:hypothetical protein